MHIKLSKNFRAKIIKKTNKDFKKTREKDQNPSKYEKEIKATMRS